MPEQLDPTADADAAPLLAQHPQPVGEPTSLESEKHWEFLAKSAHEINCAMDAALGRQVRKVICPDDQHVAFSAGPRSSAVAIFACKKCGAIKQGESPWFINLDEYYHPDYANDLNACAKFEALLNAHHQQDAYRDNVCQIMSWERDRSAVISACARTRSLAFIMYADALRKAGKR